MYDPSFQLVGQCANGPGTYGITPSSTGIYYFRILSVLQGGGAYQIRVMQNTRDVSSGLDDALDLDAPQAIFSLAADLESPGDVDCYRFQATEGCPYTVEVESLDSAPLKLELYPPEPQESRSYYWPWLISGNEGAPLFADVGGGIPEYSSRVHLVASYEGTYTACVKEEGADSAYRLTLVRPGPLRCLEPLPPFPEAPADTNYCPELCDNASDDDGDGITDCNDPDCRWDPACLGGGGKEVQP